MRNLGFKTLVLSLVLFPLGAHAIPTSPKLHFSKTSTSDDSDSSDTSVATTEKILNRQEALVQGLQSVNLPKDALEGVTNLLSKNPNANADQFESILKDYKPTRPEQALTDEQKGKLTELFKKELGGVAGGAALELGQAAKTVKKNASTQQPTQPRFTRPNTPDTTTAKGMIPPGLLGPDATAKRPGSFDPFGPGTQDLFKAIAKKNEEVRDMSKRVTVTDDPKPPTTRMSSLLSELRSIQRDRDRDDDRSDSRPRQNQNPMSQFSWLPPNHTSAPPRSRDSDANRAGDRDLGDKSASNQMMQRPYMPYYPGQGGGFGQQQPAATDTKKDAKEEKDIIKAGELSDLTKKDDSTDTPPDTKKPTNPMDDLLSAAKSMGDPSGPGPTGSIPARMASRRGGGGGGGGGEGGGGSSGGGGGGGFGGKGMSPGGGGGKDGGGGSGSGGGGDGSVFAGIGQGYDGGGAPQTFVFAKPLAVGEPLGGNVASTEPGDNLLDDFLSNGKKRTGLEPSHPIELASAGPKGWVFDRLEDTIKNLCSADQEQGVGLCKGLDERHQHRMIGHVFGPETAAVYQ